MRPLLSRGGGNLRYERNRVLKTAPVPEHNKLVRYPSVFVRVLETGDEHDGKVDFAMPRLRPPDVTETRDALISGFTLLRYRLWSNLELIPQPPWRGLLWDHLCKTWPSVSSVTRLVDSLPEPHQPCTIHGDATLANLLWDKHRRGWVWCDPLDRAFIPHDPHVDLGKGFQSCWGYEKLLLGEIDTLEFDASLASALVNITNLNAYHAQRWCHVHMIRLLPYQDPEHAIKFKELLEHVGL